MPVTIITVISRKRPRARPTADRPKRNLVEPQPGQLGPDR